MKSQSQASLLPQMPQTSLLSFLTSSSNQSPPSLPVSNPVNVQSPRLQDDGVLEKNRKHSLPKKASPSSNSKRHPEKPHQSPILAELHLATRADAFSAVQRRKEEDQKPAQSTAAININTDISSLQSSEAITLPNHPDITITSIQTSHLPALTRLTSTLLPIKYPSTFYTSIVSDPIASTFSRVALYTPVSSSTSPPISNPIGWIRCSLEPYPEATSPPSPVTPIYNQIYIKTLCLLAPYRRMGVATALLDCILEPDHVLREHNIQFVFAHVWEQNEEALEWYEKRGFLREGGRVDGYYTKLRPQGAWIMRKEIGSKRVSIFSGDMDRG